MQKLSVIGNLGGDAEVRVREDGSKFISFKVADTVRFTDIKKQVHESTTWVSCILNGDGGNLLQYLKRGVKVFVEGRPSYRLYSSEKERCMKTGVDLSVLSIELCGGSSDSVPSRLLDGNGLLVSISKVYWCADRRSTILYGVKSGAYKVDDNGYVSPLEEPAENPSTDVAQVF